MPEKARDQYPRDQATHVAIQTFWTSASPITGATPNSRNPSRRPAGEHRIRRPAPACRRFPCRTRRSPRGIRHVTRSARPPRRSPRHAGRPRPRRGAARPTIANPPYGMQDARRTSRGESPAIATGRLNRAARRPRRPGRRVTDDDGPVPRRGRSAGAAQIGRVRRDQALISGRPRPRRASRSPRRGRCRAPAATRSWPTARRRSRGG